MKRKLTNNLGLKILALLFSTVLWLIVVNLDDPVKRISFNGIPVKIANAEAITGQGKVYAVLDGSDTIDVVVSGKRSILDTLSADNIKAVADVNELTFMNTVEIKLTSNRYGDKLESITTSTPNLKLNIENMQRKQLVVSSVTTGESLEGYVVGNIATDQNLVALSGPESAISQVDKVVAAVNVEGMASDISTNVDLKLYDAEDNLIENKNIVKNIDSVNVNVEILMTAKVPIKFTTVGVPAIGYMLAGDVVGVPQTVEIAGKKSVIEAITEIEIPDINITGQSGDMTAAIRVKDYLPENVKYIGTTEEANITVLAKIEKEVRQTYTVPIKNFSATNVPTNKEIGFPNLGETVTVEISGLTEMMNTLNENTLMASVDINKVKEVLGVNEITDGIYNAELSFQLPEGVKIVSPMNVEINIYEKEVVAE